MKLTSGTIWKQFLKYFFPILAGSLLQQLYNTADSVMVGKYVGKEALSAVGGTTSILFGLVIGLFIGIASGGSVIIGRYFGAESEKDVSGAIQTSLCFSLVGGIFLGIIGHVLTPGLLVLMNTPPNIMPDAVTYMSICFYGTVPCLLYNMGSGILRALGDSRTPMFLGMISGFLNVIMNFVFIILFHMGVEGVAYATILSQTVCAVLLFVLLWKNGRCRIEHWTRPYINSHYLLQILKIGMPIGLQTIMYAISNGVVQASINTYGTDTVAGWTAYSRIVQYYWTTMAAMGITITTFVSQNHGAGNVERIKKGIKTGIVMCLCITLAFTLVFQLFGTPLIGIFTDDAGVLDIGTQMLQLLSLFLITYVCVEVFTGALRGLGYSFGTTLLTFLTVSVLSVVWVEIARHVSDNVTAVLMVFPATWTICAASLVLYYLLKA